MIPTGWKSPFSAGLYWLQHPAVVLAMVLAILGFGVAYWLAGRRRERRRRHSRYEFDEQGRLIRRVPPGGGR